jgi:alpha-glucosidase
MQWDSSAFAGFSTHEPWLPLTPDWSKRNVAESSADPASMLSLVRALLRLRRAHRSLSRGGWRRLPSHGDVLAYRRSFDDDHKIVVLNFSSAPQLWPVSSMLSGLTIALSTYGDREGEALHAMLSLRADEGVVLDMR